MQLVFPIEMFVSDIPSLPGLLRVDGPKKVFIFDALLVGFDSIY